MTNQMTHVSAGDTAHGARLGGVYSGTFSDVPNVDTTETTFISRTMPANFWPAVGARFRILAVIHCVTSGPGRQVNVYVGATPLYQSGSFNAVAGGALMLRLDAWRATATELRCFSSVVGDTVTDHRLAQYVAATVDFTAGITIAVKGQAAASGDLVYRVGHSEYTPPPAIITIP